MRELSAAARAQWLADLVSALDAAKAAVESLPAPDDYFIEEDSGYLSFFRTGQSWRIPAPSGSDQAELKTPRGATVRVSVKEGRTVRWEGNRATT